MVHFSISRTLLLFCVIFNMVFIQPCRSLSRDDILAVHNTRRCVAVLDRETRDVISRLHLRRRGCRAGEHRRRYAVAVQSVTSSALRPDGIPTIIGNRPTVNNQQLFLGRCRHTFYGRQDVRTTVRSTCVVASPMSAVLLFLHPALRFNFRHSTYSTPPVCPNHTQCNTSLLIWRALNVMSL